MAECSCAPLAELRSGHEGLDSAGTLESLERQYIVRVLRDTNGVIAGTHGAAVRLGIKRTTLQPRILKMGISRREHE
jgi:formate hydrogenlyase transcriptional activator